MILISLIAAVAFLLQRDPSPVPAKNTVTVTGGQISGIAQDGLRVYKGIPFAAPPVGPNRWRAPQPVVPWTGVRKADEYGPAPMQERGTAVLYSGNQNVKVSEDCLYLNVWTPVAHKGQKLPVMVWTYGGGFTSGLTGSPLYDGNRLAKHGVIVVSVAYRLGPFGFLAASELSRESRHGSGTYGLQDQIAGLRWVKKNIAQFGGDPSNVTIFGESAGGESTSMLAASPQAHGLFQKVISESGSSFAPTKYGSEFGHLVPSLASSEKQGAEFLQTLGANDIAAARALSADTIQKAASGLKGFPFWPARDGYILPDDQYRMCLAGHFNDTPILVGTNSDDGGMFSPASLTPAQFEAAVRAGFGDKADTILAAYPHETDAEATRSIRGVVRDVTFAWGTWSWARLQTQHGKGAAYVYYFDRHPTQTPQGAGHGSEVPYVFGFTAPFFGLSNPEDQAFSEKIQNYWVNFARTGDPNGPGLPHWPAFSDSSPQALEFDTGMSAQPLPHLTQLKAVDDYFAWRRSTEPLVVGK